MAYRVVVAIPTAPFFPSFASLAEPPLQPVEVTNFPAARDVNVLSAPEAVSSSR